MPDISATEASRNFSDLLDSVEHDGAHYNIVRRGKVVAHIQPMAKGSGSDIKALLRSHQVDTQWPEDLTSVRQLVEIDQRP